MKYSVVYLSVLFGVAASVPSHAATMTFTDEDQFLDAAGNTDVESFESLRATSPSASPVVTDSFVASISPITGSKANMQVKSSPSNGYSCYRRQQVLVGWWRPFGF